MDSTQMVTQDGGKLFSNLSNAVYSFEGIRGVADFLIMKNMQSRKIVGCIRTR